MDSSFALYLGRHTLETALLIAAPILIVCLVVGTVVTLLQAVTSIRDMTLSVIPKLLALGAVMLVFSSWMLQVTLRFTMEVFAYIQNLGGNG
jgi:flagellar biosynthetic protein FliQ